jgi:hypothetical protein
MDGSDTHSGTPVSSSRRRALARIGGLGLSLTTITSGCLSSDDVTPTGESATRAAGPAAEETATGTPQTETPTPTRPPDGTPAPVDGPGDVDETTTGVGQGPAIDVERATLVRTSEADGLQAAIDDASEGEVVLIDRAETITGPVELASGVGLRGAADIDTHVTIGEGTNLEHALNLGTVSDVHVDHVTVDGNRTNLPRGGRLIGTWPDGRVENVRITNCRLRNGLLDAVNINLKPENGHLENLVLAGNYIENCNAHGVFVGSNVDTPAGQTIRNVRMERNHVHDTSGKSQYVPAVEEELSFSGLALTLYGKPAHPTEGSAIVENYVTEPGHSGLIFEGARDSTLARNRIEGPIGALPVGVTGPANGNEITNNIVRDATGRATLTCMGIFGGGPDQRGDPHDNAFTENRIETANVGINVKGAGSNNRFEDNTFRDVETKTRGDTSQQIVRNNTWV